ncbi:TetR/AcrR family transcriptional regulator [Gordonia soli]|uniref:Putative TetR family transcriptional regulator n=1 Tax=Gordonia soli NBRC 108243 TaxID=1223545 RepID=M0QI69_9ACTN|nr:TetR/AcrR family transcriptional regulator [Gordonia soli]GAC68243.1 putative TetR family transcriptional regulator [Gordonia soli NBRC 108243]
MPTPPDREDGRAQRWEDHKAQRRDLILDAAVEAVRVDGEMAGVKDIAARAGVPRSVVYRLFKDRGDLDEHVRGRIITDLMSVLSPALSPSEGTIENALTTAVGTYVRWIVDNTNLHTFLGTGSASNHTVGSRVLTSTRSAIAGQVATVISGVLADLGADTRYAEPLAFALFGMTDATVNRWLGQAQQPLNADELAGFLETAAWHILDATAGGLGVNLTLQTRLDGLDDAAPRRKSQQKRRVRG